VGVIGLYVAQSLLFIPATLAVILPASFPGRMLLQRISEFGVINWLTWGILVFVATYFWTAWAYRPSGLQSILNKFPNAGSPLAANEFERKLAMVTLPLALGLPLIASAFFWVAQKFSFQALPASILFPVAAISLDLFQQFKIHRRMAAAFIDDQKEDVCGECHANASPDDHFCPACGIGFEENVYCDTHAATAAFSHCVICHRKLCEACSLVVQGRHVCEEHRAVELIEGWATAAITTTRLEAVLHQQQLEKLGIAARVLSNTIEPIYGTLGMFEINPVTPFLIYREVGGGRIRLMVPAAEWLRAHEHLAGAEELDELSRHT
jgi:RNA polymerase subunit RPABC4/transcription elongation factor Spt4